MTFRDTGKEFELRGDLLKMIINKNYNVDLANLVDKKLMYDFAKNIYHDEKAPGYKRLGIDILWDYSNHQLSWVR